MWIQREALTLTLPTYSLLAKNYNLPFCKQSVLRRESYKLIKGYLTHSVNEMIWKEKMTGKWEKDRKENMGFPKQ